MNALESLSLRGRITLQVASREWLNEQAVKHHYMHQAVHPRACPFGWQVLLDGEPYQPDGSPAGFVMYSSIHFTKLRGEFGYPGLPTKWQVLQLSRLWLHNRLPRNSESVVIGKSLKLVGRRWLEIHPPRNLDEPYEVRKVVSFCDLTAGFRGTVYEAANFRNAGETVSKPRHKNTRGAWASGHTLRRYVYDLPERAMVPKGLQLALFGDDEEFPGAVPFFAWRLVSLLERGPVWQPLGLERGNLRWALMA